VGAKPAEPGVVVGSDGTWFVRCSVCSGAEGWNEVVITAGNED
jgi:hypothetical protein